eukprot:gene21041-25266_t
MLRGRPKACMKLPARCLLAAILGGMAHSSHADDALTQTTISLHSAGKPVAGLIFPIGTKIELSAVANAMESGAHHARYTGNVQGRFTPPAGQQIIVLRVGLDCGFFREKLTKLLIPWRK